MYFVMYNQKEEMICEDMDTVANKLISGWKLYGYSDTESFAYSLLHECENY